MFVWFLVDVKSGSRHKPLVVDWSSTAGTGTQGVFLFEAAMLSRKQ